LGLPKLKVMSLENNVTSDIEKHISLHFFQYPIKVMWETFIDLYFQSFENIKINVNKY